MSELWPHQRDAVAFARARSATMLHMGMGTGKTRVVLALAREWDVREVLVLCPLSVAPVWPSQVAKHAADSGWRVVRADVGTVLYRSRLVRDALGARLGRTMVVANYDACIRRPLRDALLDRRWDLVVADESHKLKAPFGKTSRTVSEVGRHAARRLACTGTLMPNNPLEAWAQYRFLDPDALGRSFVAHRARYARIVTSCGFPRIVGFQHLDELAARVAPLTFRADSSVLDLLPLRTERVEVHLCAEAARVYADLRKLLRARVTDGTLTVDNALTKLLRLQQITGGSMPLDDAGAPRASSAVTIDTNKRDALADLIEACAPEPVVVFARFVHDLDAAHAAAKQAGATSLELSGRTKQLDAWQRGAARVLAVQQQSGGLGVDMTRARYAAFYSLGFSLGDYEQAVARLHRPGQERGVVVYHLVAKGTVDEVVHAALRTKRSVVQSVLDKLRTKEVDDGVDEADGGADAAGDGGAVGDAAPRAAAVG